MADKKISALTAASAVAAADYVHIVTDTATTPVNKRITGTYFFKNMFVDGNSATPIVVTVGAIDVTTPVSYLSITGTKAYSLAAGNQGQIKVLICTAVSGTPQLKLFTFSRTSGSSQWEDIAIAGNGAWYKLTNNPTEMYASLMEILDEICKGGTDEED